jgi:hypothetical protein
VSGFQQRWGNPTPGQVAQLEQKDPALARQLVQEFRQLQSGDVQLAELRNQREFRQQQLAAYQQEQQREANIKAHEAASAEVDEHLAKVDAAWAKDPAYRTALQQEAAKIVQEMLPESMGMLARGERYATKGEQLTLYHAAKQRVDSARLEEVKRNGRAAAAARQVQPFAPSMRQPAGVDTAERWAGDVNRLPRMNTLDATREGARLLGARRQAARG